MLPQRGGCQRLSGSLVRGNCVSAEIQPAELLRGSLQPHRLGWTCPPAAEGGQSQAAHRVPLSCPRAELKGGEETRCQELACQSVLSFLALFCPGPEALRDHAEQSTGEMLSSLRAKHKPSIKSI